jgi:energy-coupling factor transporter ATP-binding protein EcfA2
MLECSVHHRPPGRSWYEIPRLDGHVSLNKTISSLRAMAQNVRNHVRCPILDRNYQYRQSRHALDPDWPLASRNNQTVEAAPYGCLTWTRPDSLCELLAAADLSRGGMLADAQPSARTGLGNADCWMGGYLKKIDLHIHTVPTFSDAAFVFSLDAFKRYVADARLDAVAVTNHDVFNGPQFRAIHQSLGVTVFPGIEVNVENGHVLIITDELDLPDFETKASRVSKRITKVGDTMSFAELQAIFGDLGKYLVIPHYDKSPPITGEALEKLMPFVSAGEVDSPKKFLRAIKDASKLAPVLFSDCRIKEGLMPLPTRQTYLDCGTVSLGALRACLKDKAKVTLSPEDGNRLWQVFEDGQQISTGLNVLLGARSSGKTHTLDAINETIENVKYIKQFSLVQQNDAAYEREFMGNVERRRSAAADEHLLGFKRVLEDVMDVDLIASGRKVENYIATLIKSAEEIDRHDAFSRATLFNEVDFALDKPKVLSDLIASVRQVIENMVFRAIIEKHVELRALKALARELIELLWAMTLENKKKEVVNSLIKEVKQGLKLHTAVTQVEDVDLYETAMDDRRVQRFVEIVGFLKEEAVIHEESIQGFRVEAKRKPYGGAGEIKDASGIKAAFGEAFAKYDAPYDYLKELLAKESLPRAELYRLFVKITYQILNKDGLEVSGGERSEFRLLQEIADAQNYDVLLIDEPESSFDNLFLKSDVNQIIKKLASTMPVVVVTHNNTVGASVGADYLLYTKKDFENGKLVHRIYSGHPTDRKLHSVDGRTVDNHDVVMNSLEAGAVAYEQRRQGYEAIKR